MEEQDGEAATTALEALSLETTPDGGNDEEFLTPSASPYTAHHDGDGEFLSSPSSPASTTATLHAPARTSASATEPPPTAESSSSPPTQSLPLDLSKGKHVFILSHAGKPIYSRHGDEQQLGPVMGMIQAVLALSQSLGGRGGREGGHAQVDDNDCCLRSIRTSGGHRQFVFLIRQELTFLLVTSTREPEPFLKLQLEYLYHQVVLLLTARRITRCFAANPSYDLRELLGGTHRVLSGIIDMASPSSPPSPSSSSSSSSPYTSHEESVACLLTSSVPTLPIDPALRHDLGQSLITICSSTPNLKPVLYALLLSGPRLVTLIQPFLPLHHRLHPSDLLLLFNFLTSQPSFRSSGASSESWTPLCLPRFNDTGFLYSYIGCLDKEKELFLVLISANDDPEQFRASCAVRAGAERLWEGRGWLAMLGEAALGEHRQRALNRYCNAGMAFHFMYRFRGDESGGGREGGGEGGKTTSTLTQCLSSNFFFPYVDEEAKQGVFNLYAKALLQLRYGGRYGGKEGEGGWGHVGDGVDRVFGNETHVEGEGGGGGSGGGGGGGRESGLDSSSSSVSSFGIISGRYRRGGGGRDRKKKTSETMMEVFERYPEHSLVYEIRETDCLVVSVGPDFELFALLSSAPPLTESLQCLNRLIRAIKRDERWLFMVQAQYW